MGNKIDFQTPAFNSVTREQQGIMNRGQQTTDKKTRKQENKKRGMEGQGREGQGRDGKEALDPGLNILHDSGIRKILDTKQDPHLHKSLLIPRG